MKHGDRMTVNVLGRDVELVADERVPKGAIIPADVWERAIVEMTARALAPDDYIFRQGDFSQGIAPAPKPTKPCEHCRYGINLRSCPVCSGTGRLPLDAPESEDAYAYYCFACGFLRPLRDGGGEGMLHDCGRPGWREVAPCYGYGHAIEKGLRAIAAWPSPKPAGCGWDSVTAGGLNLRCIGGSATGKFSGCDYGPCPNCAPQTPVPDPAAGDVLDDSAEAPETAPEEPRPAAGSEAVYRAGLDASACSVCRANGELCVYCDDRINGDKNGLHEYTEFWEHPSTLTALPVIDEDGDCFERPGFEWP